MSTTLSREDFVPYTDPDHKGFVPRRVNKYKSSKRKSKVRRDTLTDQIILTKEGGGENVINVEDLRRKLANLKANANVKIRKLTGQVKEDFESLARYVSWIYDTDSYSLLYEEIQKYFSETDIYQPGTVGAYCGGCLVKKKDCLPARGCSVICAGSIPPPYEDPEWDFCSDLVIWTDYDGESYEFTTLNEVEGEKDSKAIVFIEHDSIESFPGFSEAEKKTLKDHGLEQIRLVHYNPQGDPMYKGVSGGFVDLDQIKTRSVAQSQAVSSNTSSGWNGWLSIAVVIILIAFFFILFRFSIGVSW